MGYDLHITRAANWLDSESCPIEHDEWRRYAINDSDLHVSGSVEFEDDGGTSISAEIFSFSALEDLALYWTNGQICAKNPSPEGIRKMVQIAVHFNATVMGDDGELYNESGEPS